MGVVTYFGIGFVLALALIITISYYDTPEDDDGEEYGYDEYIAGAGFLGMLTVIAWPVVIPLAIFATAAWYVTENVGRQI